MSLALKARQRARRKGGSRERLFGCDLQEHLQRSGQDVPQVLRSCTEFVEQHGVVDGIYRLSGVSSNTQRLRTEFEAQRSPDLSRDIYLQDVHCVSSLCKAYCRELPNPLLTYQLYDKFADAVAIQMEEARLVKIKEVLKELPAPHYRTLEFLMRHLLRMAAHSGRTNMHARNLAIVWAPNLLRSRDIEASGFNGTAAFMEVRVQSIVVEFILTHVEQLFGDAPLSGGDSPRRSLLLPGAVPPLHVPAVLSQGDGPPQMRPYHTIIELSEHRSKGSLKAKKWRSIFNLGRSGHEAKRKSGKAEEKEKCGKVTLRPAKSMDSLSSGPSGPSGPEAARLLPKLSVKLRPQRQHSSDATPAVPEPPPELDESLEEPLEAAAESSTKSEPTTPKAPRAGPGVGGRSRAEKCAGLHISGPYAVTVPPHITSNLSRLTRGLPCPALEREQSPGSAPEPARDPRPRSEDAEQSRLSLELRDSFAFLDGPETWLEGGGDMEAVPRSPGIEDGTPGIEDGTLGIEEWILGIEDGTPGIGDGFPAVEEGMESGFMNPGERWAEQPDSYLSIEECTEQDMFFLAPGASEPDSDPDEIFLSAHDELSPLGTPEGPPGEGTALENLENPEITEIPEIPEILEIPEIPETSKIPKVLEIPEIPETSKIPKVLEILEIPEMSETPKIPKVLETPENQEIPEIPEIPEILEIPEIPETSKIPKVLEILEIPEMSETPKIPKVLETPEIPEIPEILEIPEIPQNQEIPGIPKMPEITEISEIPKVLEISETPKIPEILAQTPPEQDGPGVGDPPQHPHGEGAAEGDPSPRMEVWGEGRGLGGPAGNGGTDGAGSQPLIPGEGDPRDFGGSPPAQLPQEPPEPPTPGAVPEGVLDGAGVTPGTTPNSPSPPAPKNLELIQDGSLRPPKLIQDEPPKIPELIWDEPPKPLELIHADPPKSLQPSGALEPPKSLEPIWDEPPKSLKLIQDEPPRFSESPRPLNVTQGGAPQSWDPHGPPNLIWDGYPKSLEPILTEPPKSWDTPRPLEPILTEPPKSWDTPVPPNPIQDRRPKSLGPLLAEPPKSQDPPGPPDPTRDGRPKSLGPLPDPLRSSRRPLPILGARVMVARAVPVVPPKPHFAHALLGPSQIPLGTPKFPPGPPGTPPNTPETPPNPLGTPSNSPGTPWQPWGGASAERGQGPPRAECK
ncbi:rho GTPase-activating protein 30 [Zonotrichia albicollis]|uniref:rho GTPase-activating protein 30 n=1 Tax=Zonotrichia albicollis TaxID=44394 RepID=UPI003D80D5A0